MTNPVCSVCKSTNTRLLLKTPKFQLYQCKACTSNYVFNPTEGKYLDEDYFDAYSLKKYTSYYKAFRTKIFRENWEVITNIFPKGGKAIDIGASFGWFLECAPRSWKVLGIDQSIKIATYAQSQGMNVLASDETFLKNKLAQYELITLHNVFEHLANPTQALQIFHRALKKEGMLIIAIPNKNGLINRLSYILALLHIYFPIYTLFQCDTSSPHCFYYNPQKITHILKRGGFKPLSIRNQPIIDIDNVDKRLAMEGKTNILTKLFIKTGLIVVYHLSILFHMPDEIVIYAVKTESNLSSKKKRLI